MASDLHGRFHGGTNGRLGQIRGGRGALAAIAIDGDAERPSLLNSMLSSLQPRVFTERPVCLLMETSASPAPSPFAIARGLGDHGLEMGLILADLILLVHNSHLYEGKERGCISDP